MEEKEFDRLLKITRLKLTDEERQRIKGDIEEILKHFDQIEQIKGKEEPAYQPIHVPTMFRKDIVSDFEDVEALKKQSKMHKGYIVGPKL